MVRCKRVVEIKEGAYRADPKYGGPEYETLGTFGSYCGVNDLAAISLANQMCNEYAVDTIAAGATIAFAMECFEKGVITSEQTGGLELRFGDADAMLRALEIMLNAEGEFGKTLGQGSERAAKTWGNGAEDFLITVKGSEAPAHMPQSTARHRHMHGNLLPEAARRSTSCRDPGAFRTRAANRRHR